MLKLWLGANAALLCVLFAAFLAALAFRASSFFGGMIGGGMAAAAANCLLAFALRPRRRPTFLPLPRVPLAVPRAAR